MDISSPPKSFGVFKPVGHTVIAFTTPQALEAMAGKLLADGFDEADLTRYTPALMLAQTASDLQTASPLASMGQDLNLVKAHRALAEQGCSFLVVQAPDDDQAAKVAALAKASSAVAAQRFGSFIVEELIDATDGEQQVRESPDTGLDLDQAKP